MVLPLHARPRFLYLLALVLLVLTACRLDGDIHSSWYGVLSPAYALGFVIVLIDIRAMMNKEWALGDWVAACLFGPTPETGDGAAREDGEGSRARRATPVASLYEDNERPEGAAPDGVDAAAVPAWRRLPGLGSGLAFEWDTILMYLVVGAYLIVQFLLLAHTAEQTRSHRNWVACLIPTLVLGVALLAYLISRVSRLHMMGHSPADDNDIITVVGYGAEWLTEGVFSAISNETRSQQRRRHAEEEEEDRADEEQSEQLVGDGGRDSETTDSEGHPDAGEDEEEEDEEDVRRHKRTDDDDGQGSLSPEEAEQRARNDQVYEVYLVSSIVVGLLLTQVVFSAVEADRMSPDGTLPIWFIPTWIVIVIFAVMALRVMLLWTDLLISKDSLLWMGANALAFSVAAILLVVRFEEGHGGFSWQFVFLPLYVLCALAVLLAMVASCFGRIPKRTADNRAVTSPLPFYPAFTGSSPPPAHPSPFETRP